MRKYEKPSLYFEQISIEDIISVDYTVDGNGQEISWSQMWTSAIEGK
ncbi:MAG: hypothetical protein J6S00_04060 [Clostridia bacterium]|nr:hypothetical protein [Clostridia bacterium]